jgi:hypothetical protein
MEWRLINTGQNLHFILCARHQNSVHWTLHKAKRSKITFRSKAEKKFNLEHVAYSLECDTVNISAKYEK